MTCPFCLVDFSRPMHLIEDRRNGIAAAFSARPIERTERFITGPENETDGRTPPPVNIAITHAQFVSFCTFAFPECRITQWIDSCYLSGLQMCSLYSNMPAVGARSECTQFNWGSTLLPSVLDGRTAATETLAYQPQSYVADHFLRIHRRVSSFI